MEQICHITGNQAEAAHMLRFVVSPDGELTPDLGHKLPGDAIWIANRRDLIASLAATTKAYVSDDLALRIETLMRQQAHGLLGLARKAGVMVLGFTKVEAALKKGQVVMLFAAHDGADNGRRALARKAQSAGIEICALFGADELGMAFGRANVIHAGLTDARWATRIAEQTMRLAAYISSADSMDRSENE